MYSCHSAPSARECRRRRGLIVCQSESRPVLSAFSPKWGVPASGGGAAKVHRSCGEAGGEGWYCSSTGTKPCCLASCSCSSPAPHNARFTRRWVYTAGKYGFNWLSDQFCHSLDRLYHHFCKPIYWLSGQSSHSLDGSQRMPFASVHGFSRPSGGLSNYG